MSGATRTDSPLTRRGFGRHAGAVHDAPDDGDDVAPALTNTLADLHGRSSFWDLGRLLCRRRATGMTAEDSQTGTGRGRCPAGPGDDGQTLRVAAGERLAVSSTIEAPGDLTASVISGVGATEQQFLP